MIKMTMKQDGRFPFKFKFTLNGSGVVTVDWGDSSEKITLTLEGLNTFSHTYPNVSLRPITINGDSITKLNCYSNQLTSLDVSKNTALKDLYCYNNRLTDTALNILFRTLPCVTKGEIYVGVNPGACSCNPRIATDKGWSVLE